jgi:arsenate reductase
MQANAACPTRSMSARRAEYVLLHNPRCSKSRAALALLEERGLEHELRLYLEDPLDREELAHLRRQLACAPLAMLRAKEPEFAACGLGPESSERPILVRGERARIGRPTEALLELL